MVVLQELGFGLAIAVLLDAFVVRVVVAPAMIALIGDRYWWLPRRLEWLPRIEIEGKAPAAVTPAGAGPVRPLGSPSVLPTPGFEFGGGI